MTNILKNSFFVGLLILLASCNNLPENTFLLKGEVTNYSTEKIYLSYSNGDDRITDSCSVENGKFTFQGTINEPQRVLLSDKPYSRNRDRNRDIKIVSFYIESAKMNFNADWLLKPEQEHRNSPYALTGSKVNDEAAVYEKMLSTASGNTYVDSIKQFVKQYPDSYISVSNLNHFSSRFSIKEIESLCNELGEKAKSYSPYQEIQKTLAALYAIQPGKPAPDFTRTTLTGETIKLSDYRGKVVLLDFWASWCKPCRASMPHVKELYKKYKDKGLVVICIGDNDSQPDAWKGAIDQDGTAEFIHVLRGLKITEDGFDRSDDLSEFYTVHEIPSKFIINADGILEGVKIEDADLDVKLQKLLGI